MSIAGEPSQILEQQRLQAAKASGGISSDVIYGPVLRLVQEFDLRGTVFDFGAGVGNLTQRLWTLSRFEQISGADILPRPQDLPSEIFWYCLDLKNRTVVPAGNFDLVIAAEVIEHLENPREIAREWYRILKPGGRLILSTPNNESIRSLFSLVIRGHYAAFNDDSYPAHITAVLRKDLARILCEVGFSDACFRFTDSGGVPKMPSLSWQKISFGLLRGCRFSDNLIATAVK